MKDRCVRTRFYIPLIVAVLLGSIVLRPVPVVSADPASAKGPEVVTVGSGPYLGPTPQELAKAAQLEAGAAAAPTTPKAASLATIAAGGDQALTADEQAKLAGIEEFLRTLNLPFDVKPEPMLIPEDGIPALTEQEQAKRAQEAPSPTPMAPDGPKPPEIITVSPYDPAGMTPEEIAKSAGAPAAATSETVGGAR